MPPRDDSIMAVTPPPKSSSENSSQLEVTTIDTDEDDDHDEGEIIEEEPLQPLVLRDSRVSGVRKPIKTLADLSRAIDSIWSGLLVLKKNLFRSKFYLLAGSDTFVTSQLDVLNKKPSPNLQINQRIRVDSPKIEDLEKTLLNVPSPTSSSSGSILTSDSYSVILALPSAETGNLNFNQAFLKLLILSKHRF